MNTSHLNQEINFPKILNIIFSGDSINLKKELKKNGLNDFDLNVLYSIRKQVYQGAESYNSIEQKFYKKYGEVTSRYSIVKAILGVIDSTVAMNYLQTRYNHNTNEYETNIKPKFSSDQTVYEMVSNINESIIGKENKQEILEKYKIELTGVKDYQITINDFKIGLKTSNIGYGVLGKDFKTEITTTLPTIKDLAKIDYRNKLIQKSNLSEEENMFMSLLSFIDDMLKTSFSKDTDGLLEFSIFQQLNTNGLKHLFLAASRGLVITDIYNKFNQQKDELGLTNQQLEQFLTLDIYPAVNISKLSKMDKRQLIGERSTGNYLLTVISSEDWLHNLSHAKAILSGDISKATIKNAEGDAVPNFSPAFEGAFIKSRCFQARSGISSKYLLFSQDPNSLVDVVIDADITTKSNVKNLTKGDLLYHSIVDKYFIPQLKSTENIIIQPTTFSDKTKFVNYITNSTINNIKLTEASTSTLEQLMLDTLGEFYKSIWNQVLNDYEKLLGTRNLQEINKKLSQTKSYV